MKSFFARFRNTWSVPVLFGLALLLCGSATLADTPLTLKQSWAGNINYVGTQKTLRNRANDGSGTNPACQWVGATATTSAAITGIPASATITAAYLYWAGSGATADYNVTFEGTAYTATSQYTSTSNGSYRFFSGVVDVSSKVVAKRNGTYSLTNLTIDNTNNQDNYCSSEAVLGGWSLLVIYSDASEPLRVINLYEGFQYYYNSSITITLSNFLTPTPLGTNTGKAAHISWEGDPTLSGGGETLTFQGIELTDANNTSGNQFNSVSNIAAVSPSTGAADNAAYGVDFDAYVLDSTKLTAGMSSATTVYSSGGDLVLLSAEVISVPNVPVADLGITMGYSGTMGGGQTVTYTLDVTNNGPNTETGPITVTNTPPAGLTYTGASGSGWSCPSPYTTCTRTGTLASGASANPITLTATVSSSATGNITNTATVAGTLFDNISSNNTATDTRAALAADLAMSMAGGSLTPGSNSTYTLTVTNNGPDTHAGTISVSDVLPSGLTYVSGTGTGWNCSAGVTCTYSGSLASGASAPTITLTVAVASGATGPITNSATVTGVYYDSSAANNTASLSWGSVTTGGCTTGSVDGDVLITCTSNGTVTIPSGVTNARYLVVGGGGGGGGIGSDDEDGAGGGGAGGVLAGSSFTVSPGTTYNITVGTSGDPGTGSANGSDGGNSVFATLTADGGGGGAREGNHDGRDGGSGGGGSGDKNGGNGTTGQGNDGGDGNKDDGGGGGGGAGAAGSDGTNTTGGNGGNGVANDITGTSLYYGGGGGGGADGGGSGGSGGNGGGGAGATGRGAGNPGTGNTGGGGGGATGSGSGSAYSGGAGGSGIVILRYTVPGPQVCEGFESGLGGWTVTSDQDGDGNADSNEYGTAVIDTTQAQSGTKSVLMSRDWVRVTMNSAINTAGASGSITFGYGRGLGGTDYPEPGDDMLVEYLNSSNAWTTLTTISGVNSSDSSWQTAAVTLPANAKHSGFKIRLTQIQGSGNATTNNDRWNIDNVCVPGSASSAVDHLRIDHGSTGLTCLREAVVFKACASADCSSLYAGGDVALTLSPAGQWYAAATGGTVLANPQTVPASGSLTLYLQQPTLATVSVNAPVASGPTPTGSPTVTCNDNATAAPCSIAFTDAGLIFTASNASGSNEASIANQVAGETFPTSYYLRAVKSDKTTGACVAAVTASRAVTLSYSCIDPATCAGNYMTLNGGSAFGSGGTSASLSFDTNGYSTTALSFNYFDVGEVKLAATTTSDTGASLTGNSNEFVVKPWGFSLAATCADSTVNAASQSSPSTSDPKFCRAGQNFTATATAITQAGSATPNYGKETTPETVSAAWSRQLPASGTDGTLPSGSLPYAGSGGVFGPPVTPFTWDEVGILKAVLTVGDGNYLGAGDVSSTAYVGRFYPDHFDVALTPPPGCTGFVYAGRAGTPVTLGQPFTVVATAKNGKASPTTTTNYNTTAGFSKDVNLSLTAGGTGVGKIYVDSTQGGAGAIPAGSFVVGIGTVNYNDASGKISYVFDTFPTMATNIAVHADDGESVTTPMVAGTDGTASARSGRLRLSNAYGSELLDIRLPVRAEYFNATTTWSPNADDGCTVVPTSSIALGNYLAPPAGTAVSTINMGVVPTDHRPVGNITLTGGSGTIVLIKPNPVATGSFDVVVNLGTGIVSPNSCATGTFGGGTAASLAYLLGNWCGGSYDRAPSARVKLGASKTPYIYLRERY